VVLDATLDPGAVSQKFWTYRYPGAYYGVPWSNFVGWILSGIVGAAILQGLRALAIAARWTFGYTRLISILERFAPGLRVDCVWSVLIGNVISF
jgi:uncharacterized membrane protein